MAHEVDFWKSWLEEYMAYLSLCLSLYQPEVLHCSGNRISVNLGRELDLYYK